MLVARLVDCSGNADCVVQAGLHGVVPVTRGCFEPLQENAFMPSNRLKQAFAVCNGLTMFNKSTVVGDDLGHRLFKLVEARFKASEFYNACCCLLCTVTLLTNEAIGKTIGLCLCTIWAVPGSLVVALLVSYNVIGRLLQLRIKHPMRQANWAVPMSV